MGGTPVNSSAGNAMKLPPPATEFSAPPSAPAKKRKMADSSVKKLGVSETATPANGHNLLRPAPSEAVSEPHAQTRLPAASFAVLRHNIVRPAVRGAGRAESVCRGTAE